MGNCERFAAAEEMRERFRFAGLNRELVGEPDGGLASREQ